MCGCEGTQQRELGKNKGNFISALHSQSSRYRLVALFASSRRMSRAFSYNNILLYTMSFT